MVNAANALSAFATCLECSTACANDGVARSASSFWWECVPWHSNSSAAAMTASSVSAGALGGVSLTSHARL